MTPCLSCLHAKLVLRPFYGYSNYCRRRLRFTMAAAAASPRLELCALPAVAVCELLMTPRALYITVMRSVQCYKRRLRCAALHCACAFLIRMHITVTQPSVNPHWAVSITQMTVSLIARHDLPLTVWKLPTRAIAAELYMGKYVKSTITLVNIS